MKRKILNAVQKFGLDMRGKTVLTEAATGNYVVTSVIAACAGANVLAYTKDSSYGSEEETTRQTSLLASILSVLGLGWKCIFKEYMALNYQALVFSSVLLVILS